MSSIYGNSPYGQSGYGVTSDSVSVAAIFSIDPFTSEILFSGPVNDNSDLVDPMNYVWTSSLGATVITESVEVVTAGVLRIRLYHTGTTFGVNYTITVSAVTSVSGFPLFVNTGSRVGQDTGPFASPTLTVGDDSVEIEFTEDFFDVPEAENVDNYEITTDYVIPAVISAITVSGSSLAVEFSQMTTTEYEFVVGSSLSVLYIVSETPVPPDSVGGFDAVESGTGSSVIFSSTLQMTTSSAYAWDFQDTSGRLQAGSTYRVTTTVDLGVYVYTGSPVFTVTVRDGDVNAQLLFGIVSGNPVVTLASGAYSQTVIYDWRSEFTIVISYNSYVGLFVVSFDDVPYFTTPKAAFTGPFTGPEGVSLAISAPIDPVTIRVRGLLVTASATLLTVSQNFIHYIPLVFTGASATAIPFIQTSKGPLVKTWGDYTPAEIEDVAVRLDGIDYPLLGVNPYAGKIYLDPPIPLMPMGAIDVDVDYHYMEDASFGMLLNVEGLGWNSYSRPYGRVSSGYTGTSDPDRQRFPLRAQLGPGFQALQPITTGYRYLGYELAQSALMNRGDSLVLNAASFVGTTRVDNESVNIRLDGDPLDGWVVSGVTGTYATSPGSQAVKFIPTQNDSRFQFAARVRSQGVFTGAFSGVYIGGVVNGVSITAGLLRTGGCDHIGVYKTGDPSRIESWDLGPGLSGTLTSYNRVNLPLETPVDLYAGSRLNVISGIQAGVYEVTSVVRAADHVVVEFSPSVPFDPGVWGSSPVVMYPETKWQNRIITLRVSSYGNDVSVYAAGDLTWVFSARAQSLFLSDYDSDSCLFGQLSGGSVTSQWDFLYFSATPILPTEFLQESQGEDFGDWFPTSSRGIVDSLSAGASGLRKYEPAMNSTVTVLETETDFLFAGGEAVAASVTVHDRKRRFRVDFLTVYETSTRILAYGDSAVITPESPSVFATSGPYVVFTGDQDVTLPLSGGNVPGITTYSFHFRAIVEDGDVTLGGVFNNRAIGFRWQSGSLLLTDLDGNVVATSPNAWAPGEEITYLVGISSTVNVIIVREGVVTIVFSEPRSSFPVDATGDAIRVISAGTGSMSVSWVYAGEELLAAVGVRRTLGIKVGDTGDFDTDYVLAQSTQSPLENSNISKPVLSVNWASAITLRMHLDPQWGGVLEIPSLGFPGYYTPEFATSSTNPTRGYATREYAKLPYVPQTTGYLEIAVNQSVTEISNTLYQIRGVSNRKYQNTRSMTLNKAYVANSGELQSDKSPEYVQIQSRDGLIVSLVEANFRASVVYQVIDAGTTRIDFVFDSTTQTLTMNSPLTDLNPVVVFSPTSPVTVSYLTSQPKSETNLYRGTPPFVYSQTTALARMILYGTAYDGTVTELVSESISDPLTSYGFGNSGELFSEITAFEYPDGGDEGAMASLQDSLIDFTLVVP